MHIVAPESVAGVALAAAAIALTVRYVPIINRAVLGVAALAPYLMLGAPVSLIVFALRRDWILMAAAAAVTIATVVVQLPWYVRSAAMPGVGVRLMSANLRYGRADAGAVVSLAREHADILAVQELTLEQADLMSAAGVDEAFPFQALRACDGPAGVGIWSRYPISTSKTDDDFWLGLVSAKVRIPKVMAEATVVVTHLSAPWPDPIAGWRTDLDRMAKKLPQVAAAGDRAVMVAGDFNATRDLREFRRLLRDGYRDAAEQAGAGLTRTHPADIWLPPVFAVDHILTRGCDAIAVRTLVHIVAPPGARGRHPAAELTTSAITARSPTCRETPDSIATADSYLLFMDFVPEVGYFLAEWYLPELTEQSVDDVVAKLDIAAISVSDEGTPVRLVVTLAVPTDEVLYGVFGAQSPDIVTTTCQRAGIPHQRLSAHVGTRIREESLAAMVGKSCTRTSVEPEPTPQ